MDLSLIVSLHLEAGPAWQTLTSLGRQTDTQVYWAGDDDVRTIDTLRTPAVHGRYSVADAWCAALKGTGLTWEISVNSLSIRPARPGEYEAQCQARVGWGPDFVHPPQANWT